jgi:hypothetical protein
VLPGIGITGSPRKVLDRKTCATIGEMQYICGREYVPKAEVKGHLKGGKALSEYPADMRVHRSDIEATLLGRGILCEYSLLG